jgi:hypothetical protein
MLSDKLLGNLNLIIQLFPCHWCKKSQSGVGWSYINSAIFLLLSKKKSDKKWVDETLTSKGYMWKGSIEIWISVFLISNLFQSHSFPQIILLESIKAAWPRIGFHNFTSLHMQSLYLECLWHLSDSQELPVRIQLQYNLSQENFLLVESWGWMLFKCSTTELHPQSQEDLLTPSS